MYPRGVSNEMGKLTTIKREATRLWAVNRTKIPQYRQVILKIRYQDSSTIQAKFYVCKNDTAILGLRPCIQLGLVQFNGGVTKNETRKIESIEDLANEYPDRFQGIGNFSGKLKKYLKKRIQHQSSNSKENTQST